MGGRLMDSRYYVVIIHAQGYAPELMSDKMNMALTFDTREEAQAKIVEYWRINQSSRALRLTVIELED
jgi:hypothetical protein